MNVKNFEYVKKIEEKKYKDFDSFFESDEFNKIEDLEIKRKVFYYFANHVFGVSATHSKLG